MQEAPQTFWPVVQVSSFAAVAVYLGINLWWRRMPNYAHRARLADIQVRANLDLEQGNCAAARPAGRQ